MAKTTTRTFEIRRGGTSTAIALKTIAAAIENPGVPVDITDHFKDGNKYLARTIEDMITALNLQNIEVVKDGKGWSLISRHYPVLVELGTGDIYQKIT